MSTYIKNNRIGNSDKPIVICEDMWDLDTQLEALKSWFNHNPAYDFSLGEWIVDIGFEPRPSATVAGYTIPVELMRTLSSKGITLWLSDYLNNKNA
jgi:hypothetical protein